MSGFKQARRVNALLVALLAGGVASLCAAQASHPQGGGQAGVAERLPVVRNGHVELFKVDRADASVTTATLVYGSTGFEAPGYTLTSTVLVKGDDLDLVRKIASSAVPAVAVQSPRVTVSQDVPGWIVVETSSVREAIDVAEAIRATGQFKSVSVDWEEPVENRDLPTDPLVVNQWHLLNTDNPGGDLNVVPVYDMGYTGAGVVVGILEAFDDNFWVDHPDLAGNWNQTLSMDTTPFSTWDSQMHPTNVAGIIAAVANNDEGVAGVAYNAKLARLRNGTKLVRGRALQWWYNSIPIKSNSWGPANPPGVFPAHTEDEFVMDALARAARIGRGGKGAIYLFASGNDGPADRVDLEPLGSSRFTLAIGAVDEENNIASYSQGGTSLFATAYSRAAEPTLLRGIQTTGVDIPESEGGPPGVDETYVPDVNGNGDPFSGTSAACPMAAGVIALMLEANPNLTFRDIQHILADTARPVNFTNGSTYFFGAGFPLLGDTWWQVNGAFTRHSDEYGFGVIDAEAAVNAALSWSGAPSPVFLNTYDIVPEDGTIPGAEFVEVPPGEGTYFINNALSYGGGGSFSDTFCVKPDIRLESVEVEITTNGAWVGDLEILLISPWGSVSPLALVRTDPGTYTNYVFTTLKHWDEPSAGEWTLQITDLVPDGPFDVEDATVDLSPYGMDGVDGAGEKTITSYAVRFYGSEFPGGTPYLCDPNNQSCPGDLNGDGIVSPEDLIFFLDLYYAGDPFADINGDGVVNYDDVIMFFNMFVPGFCPSPDNDGPGGRPMPGGSDNGRPVGGAG